LARELGLTNKELMDLLEREGHGVKSHASSLADDLAALVRDMVFAERKAKAAPAPAAPEAPAAEAAAAAKPPAKPPAKPAAEAAKQPPKELHFKVPVTVRELAEAICRKPNELIGELMMMNVFATINNLVEIDVIEKICQRHGITFIRERRGAQAKPRRELAAAEAEAEAEAENTVPRPPVVAFLGHVDHGKTSLQDAIRKTNVAGGEAGGITQSIGASVVEWNGQQITMIDTPGHEAFTAMRARGASATDIVILVVAADDGLMPQTIEAIQHAQAAKVPMLVAMNKMDLPGANPDHVKLGMQQQGVTCEEWGGDVGIVPVSAITRQGIEDLLERILLEAEMLELKGNPDIPAKGLVIEAQLETGMGPTANLLVRNGTLHVGDVIVCGKCFGRIKAMIDYHGKRVKQAGPSTPVKVMGLSGVPDAGDLIEVYADEKEARAIAEQRIAEARQTLNVSRAATTVEELFSKMQETTRTELKVILKTDVRGSLEAIQGSFAKIKSAKITLNLIAGNVGEITENDVLLASTSKATILGFNVRAMPGVQALARREKVEIRLYGIIYEMLDDVEAILLGRLAPESRETRVGKAEIIQVIVLSKGAGKICGCRVSEGAVRVGANAIVTRGQDVIYKGRIASLRRFKEDAKEVKSGLECGIRLDNFEDFEVGDAIEVFTVEKVAATL
jgi:translation initiation factor IF-2